MRGGALIPLSLSSIIEKLTVDFQIMRLSKWALLAAMQALAIYILIRLHEGETEDNNLDVLLPRTVRVR